LVEEQATMANRAFHHYAVSPVENDTAKVTGVLLSPGSFDS
jgi:hypothetical protein